MFNALTVVQGFKRAWCRMSIELLCMASDAGQHLRSDLRLTQTDVPGECRCFILGALRHTFLLHVITNLMQRMRSAHQTCR